MYFVDLLVMALAAAGVLMVGAALAAAWRLMRDPAQARVGAVLRAHGLVPAPESGELRAAVRRCAQCGKVRRCTIALATEDWTALRAFCPNIRYFDSLRPG